MDRNRPRPARLVATLLLAWAFSLTLGAASTSAEGEAEIASAPATPCSNSIRPGDDVTAALTGALQTASHRPVPGLFGPSGMGQGRVYLGPGRYGIRTIVLPDNVRIEIAPGATIFGVRGQGLARSNDWGLFEFGTPTVDGESSHPSRNVSIVAGNGCGGPGQATAANKPSNTNFRGNRAAAGGMANAPVPFRSRWNTSAMWVMDLDPEATGVGVQVTGFMFRWAYDIAVSDVFTIQNPARATTGIGPVPGETSRTVAMMFDPPNHAQFLPDPEGQYLPHRVSVTRHYNILSPSGQGANQIRACRDCRFTEVFSHGGVALRVETDGIRPAGPDCGATGADGAGFREFAIVDGLKARSIEGAFGNRVAMFTPHCLPNGKATVNDVRGTTMGELVVLAPQQPDAVAGGFTRVRVTDVCGCGGVKAQEPHPDLDSYLVAPSRAAASISGPNSRLTGTWRWPGQDAPGGLADGVLPASHGASIVHDGGCP